MCMSIEGAVRWSQQTVVASTVRSQPCVYADMLPKLHREAVAAKFGLALNPDTTCTLCEDFL